MRNTTTEATKSILGKLPRIGSGAAIVVGVILISALFVLLAAFFLAEKKRNVEDGVRVLTGNFVGAIDQQVTSNIDKIDLVILALAEELQSELGSKGRVDVKAIDGLTAKQVARIPELSGLRVTDENGKLIAGTGVSAGAPATYGDRDFFQSHRTHINSGFIVSAPLFGRVSREWVIVLSRRFEHPDGSFAGVIAAAILVDHFTKLLSVLDLGPGGIALIRDTDLGMVTRYPPIEGRAGAVGDRGASRELTDLVKSGVPKGTFHSEATADGVERTGSYRILSHAPYVVIAGMASDHYLAEWRGDIRKSAVLVGVFVVVLSLSGALLGWLLRHLKQREASFRMLFDNHPLPMWVWDHETFGYLAVNDAAVAQYGYSREEFLGMSVLDLRPAEDRELIRQAARERGGSRRTNRMLRHLKADGALIDVMVHAQTLQYAGRTATLAVAIDITTRKRAEDELRWTKSFLDTVLNYVPAAITVKGARDNRYLLTNKKGEAFFGLPREQIIGRTPDELFGAEAGRAIVERDREALECDGLEFTGQVLHAGSCGYGVVSTKKVVIRDAKGEPEHLLSIIEDITDRVRAAEQAIHMARHDALTGLANRVLFAENANQALCELSQSAPPFSILLLDLDQFKHVNDTLGHPTGDALLIAVARRLQDCVGSAGLVARFGGDEFAILQRGGDNQNNSAIALANKILEFLVEPYELAGHRVTIGTSIGIVMVPDHGTEFDQLMKCADLALYQAKSTGRNQYFVFESALAVRASTRLTLENDLRRALKGREFEVYYQPVVNLATCEPCAAEAQIRWNHPTMGMTSPDRFIPVAEDMGLIVDIGEWVLRTACADAVGWPSHLALAVNLSSVQFSQGDLVGVVVRALRDSGLPPKRLELEITESVLLEKTDENIALLHKLRSVGVSIVLDDFGTGYSSLSYLKMFPWDKIKIDRSFVEELGIRGECSAIVGAVVGLGRSLHIATTAEGVETEKQRALLRAAGCTLGQGYLFGRPVPKERLAFNQENAEEHVQENAYRQNIA
jgi:diguanylate cyclase (GGDEF)-like protein/PAS domain S-box-containing protein